MSAPSVLKSEEPYRVIPSEIESIEVQQDENLSRGTVEQKKILKSSGDIGQSVSDLLPSEQPTQTDVVEPSIVESLGPTNIAIIAGSVLGGVASSIPYLVYEGGKDIVNVFSSKKEDVKKEDKKSEQPVTVVVSPKFQNVFKPEHQGQPTIIVSQKQTATQKVEPLKPYRRRKTKK